MGPGGPGGISHPQGRGAPYDKWNGGTKVPPSTGLGGSLQNSSSGEIASRGGGKQKEVPGPGGAQRAASGMMENGLYGALQRDAGKDVRPADDMLEHGPDDVIQGDMADVQGATTDVLEDVQDVPWT